MTTQYGSEEANYLYRVEQYLIHKYEPELADTLMITFHRAKSRREDVVVHDSNVITTREELLIRIVRDIQNSAVFRPKNRDHKGSRDFERPGIGEGYQSQFENL